mgnify:CR=1 FL=1
MIDPYYYRGDIIAVKNIKFKDNNFIDTRINGHPILILNQVNTLDDDLYALKISGSYSNIDGLKNYYILKPNGQNKLRKASYIDLRYVYKLPNQNITCYNKCVSEKQYNEIEKEIEKIQSSENINTYQLNLLSDELNDRVAFERLKLRVKSIQENECNGKIFYDTGYERLFQYAGGNEKMFFILFMMIFSVLILSPIGAADKKTDMVKVIFSTKSGKTGYYRDLFLYGILCGIFSATLFFFPYIFNILKKYGTQGLSAPIQSIQQFSNLDISISVCGFILFFLFIHIIGSIICSVSIAGISSLCKSRTSAYIINTALFVLPVILILLKSRLAYGV